MLSIEVVDITRLAKACDAERLNWITLDAG
jgi:hypothetical protein